MNRLAAILIFLMLSSFAGLGQDLFDAARTGNVKRLDELIRLNPDTVYSKNAAGFTALIIAGYRDQLNAVELLLKHKSDVNADSPEGTALLGACYKGNVKLTQMLINYRANVNAVNSQGTSALMYAALANNLELVKLLLEKGADKTLVETSGRTALSYAQKINSEEMIRLLTP